MTEQKPDVETKKCPYCPKMLPVTWIMQAYDGFVIWVNEHHQWVHRHNTTYPKNPSYGKKGKTKAAAKQADTPTVTEQALMSEYFPEGKAPASGRILIKKAASGDLAALKELNKRFGWSSQAANPNECPVQIEIEGTNTADHNDPRPILKLKKGLLSDPATWEDTEEDEDDTQPERYPGG